MKRSNWLLVLTIVFVLAGVVVSLFSSCEMPQPTQPTSTTGVKKATAKVNTGVDGLTTEQRNVKKRLEEDNKPGSIKHLYVISAWSGQVIVYSTVKGKITSSGKRLTPVTVSTAYNTGTSSYSKSFDGIAVNIGGEQKRTGEVLQDDGTYGSSIPYVFWWDVKGIYHQHYISGGQILHVSNQPIPVKNITINMELVK